MTGTERRKIRDEARAYFEGRQQEVAARLFLRLLEAEGEEARETLVNASEARLLHQAQGRALLAADPDLSQPEDRPVLERVRALFSDTPDIFN